MCICNARGGRCCGLARQHHTGIDGMFRSLSCPPLVPELAKNAVDDDTCWLPRRFRIWMTMTSTSIYRIEITSRNLGHTAFFIFHSVDSSSVPCVYRLVPVIKPNSTKSAAEYWRCVVHFQHQKTESDRTHTAPPRLCEWQWRNHPKLFPIHRRYCICIDRYSKEKRKLRDRKSE